MFSWLLLTIFAYFLDAVVFVIDKALLSESIPHPRAYAFFVAVLSGFAVVLIPFGVHMLNSFDLTVSLICGLSFFVGLLLLYRAVMHIDVTEVVPAVGAVTAIATFFITLWILPRSTNHLELLAFALLVGGTLLMSYFHISSKIIWSILGSGIAFGASFATLKFIFELTDFVNGLFWTRMGLLLGAGILLMFPRSRREIAYSLHRSSGESKFVFIANKILSATTFILLYYAIKIGDVVFVNALQGVQYVFILVIGAFLYRSMPQLFEHHKHDFTVRKIIATSSIVAGLVLLFIQ